MSRIQKHLKKLEAQRRSKPVTQEMWQHWLAHPMTEIFFLSLDAEHAKMLTDKRLSIEPFWTGHHEGRIDMIEEIINYEPHDIADTEGEQSDD